MNHFLYGASIPFLTGAIIYYLKGQRTSLRMLIMVPLAMVFLGTWAVAPDIPRMLGFQDLYLRLSMDPRCNIFLWHYALDQMETAPGWYACLERDSSWFAFGIVIEAGALMTAALRELFREERS